MSGLEKGAPWRENAIKGLEMMVKLASAELTPDGMAMLNKLAAYTLRPSTMRNLSEVVGETPSTANVIIGLAAIQEHLGDVEGKEILRLFGTLFAIHEAERAP